MDDFIQFIRKQGVVGLAVGLAIGLAATGAVNTIVAGFIDPIVGWLLGLFLDTEGGLEAASWTLVSGDNPLIIGWGAILSALISLMAVALVIYLVIMKTGLNKLDKEAE